MPFKDNIFLDCLRKHHFHICRGNHRQKEEGGFLLLILFNFVPFFLFFSLISGASLSENYSSFSVKLYKKNTSE